MNVRDDLIRVIDRLLGDDPHEALVAYRRLTIEELPWIEQRVVALARKHGWNWASIGRLLGRTRQGVQQRFRNIKLSIRPDPNLLKHRQEAVYFGIADDTRRAYDDDPIAW